MSTNHPVRKRVAIVGVTGYAGAELTALMASHQSVDLVGLYSSSEKTTIPFSSIHPSLARREGPAVQSFSLEAITAAAPDVVFLATPNEVSAEVVPLLLENGMKVIDLSGAFRLHEPADYPRWYGFKHEKPELLVEAVYGLTEWCNGELKSARLVANPGCYPTSILLAIRPIIHLLDDDQPVICDSKSGISGAGKKSEVAYSFTELFGNFKAYGVGQHRHEPEIRQGLKLGTKASLVFVPHLLPTPRGILSTIHVGFSESKSNAQISALYEKAYGHAPFVDVLPAGQLPDLKSVIGTPRAEIGFTLIQGGRRAVIVSVLDNLLKGAASQAVQNFNRMSGFAEGEGLH